MELSDLTVKNVYKCKDGRLRAYCVDNENKAHVISYPRILMIQKLGRSLKPDEDVHHKDENVNNNQINNFEIIAHGEHQRQHSSKYVDTIETCQICGKQFLMTKTRWKNLFSNMSRKKENRKYGINCSRSCSSKYGSGTYKPLYDVSKRLLEVSKLWN